MNMQMRLRLTLMPMLLIALSVEAKMPLQPIQLCTDYHCDKIRAISVTPSQWRKIRTILLKSQTADEERNQLKQAIALMEKIAGEQTDLWQDKAKNEGEASEPGQIDCIAESINTTTYLHLFAADGLLRWHRVLDRRQRGSWFTLHWGAVIQEQKSRISYAVDSWLHANGAPPKILPLASWLAGDPAE